MATNLALDDRLIEEARRVGRHKTKREAVSAALAEYVKRRKQLRILDAFGTVDFDPKYDYKAERSRKRLMMVLVDTSVWSLALRRKQTDLSSQRAGPDRSACGSWYGKAAPRSSDPSVRSCSQEYAKNRPSKTARLPCGPSTIPSWR